MDNIDRSKLNFWAKLIRIPGIGILIACISGVFFATASLTVKLVDSLSGVEVAVIRSLVTAISYIVVIIVQRQSLRPIKGETIPLLSRATFGTIALILTYSSIKLIPLGDSNAIVFSSPVFVAVFACILLKEACGIIQIISIFLAISGIFLISKPSFIFPKGNGEIYSDTRTLGSLLALGACLGAAMAIVSMRALKKTPIAVVIVWYSVSCTIVGTIVCLIQGELVLPERLSEYGWLVLCGACGTIGQGLLTLSLKLENAGPVALARTMDILMAFVYQITVLKEIVPWTSSIGAVVLTLGVVTIALNKWWQSDPDGFKRVFLCRDSVSSELQVSAKSFGGDIQVRRSVDGKNISSVPTIDPA